MMPTPTVPSRPRARPASLLYVLVVFSASMYAAFLSFKALEHYSGWHWALWMLAALLAGGEFVTQSSQGKRVTHALLPAPVRRTVLWLLVVAAGAWTWQQDMWQFWLVGALVVHGLWRFWRSLRSRRLREQSA